VAESGEGKNYFGWIRRLTNLLGLVLVDKPLEMIDELISWGRTPPPVVADAGYGESTALRLALTDCDIPYVVAVRATLSAHRARAVPVQPPRTVNRGRPPAPAYPDPPTSLKKLAIAAGADAAGTITWRDGTKASPANPAAAMSSQSLTLRIRPANRDIPRAPDASLPECRLIAQWPPVQQNPPITGSPVRPPTPL
jgi:hypothetical protein